MIPAVALAALVAVTSAAPDRDPDVVRKSFVILKATPSYADARALAAAAAERLAIRLDLRDLVPDAHDGPDLLRRTPAPTSSASSRATSRAAAGTTASTSASSTPARTSGFDEGQYIVVLASGSPRDRAIGAALRRARGQYPDVRRQDRARVPRLHPLKYPFESRSTREGRTSRDIGHHGSVIGAGAIADRAREHAQIA